MRKAGNPGYGSNHSLLRHLSKTHTPFRVKKQLLKIQCGFYLRVGLEAWKNDNLVIFPIRGWARKVKE
jgi:hypothetical protein